MKEIYKKKAVVFAIVAVLIASISTVSLADWTPGDGHKMHYPQLPDKDGWDVYATAGLALYPDVCLADDWECSETGWITDIHFWGSWLGDREGTITRFVIGVAANIPAGAGGIPYSRPGDTLIEWEIYEWITPPIDPPGMQGFYFPFSGEALPNDHQNYYQYNIFLDEVDWFWQEAGTIYWLFISAIVEEVIPQDPQPLWGWKSSEDHWEDDACWTYWDELNWIDLWEPSPPPKTNQFWIEFGPDDHPINAGGTDYYDDGTSFNGWYYYPYTNWWNIWFYDHPFDPERYKEIFVHFNWFPTDEPYWIEVAINWATPEWPYLPSGENPPPIPSLIVPPEDELRYISRAYIPISQPGPVDYVFTIPDYNPEWVSIDVRGMNIVVTEGLITHECLPQDPVSLDLAFVITGEKLPSVDIEKTVWDGANWVEEINADVGETVSFKIDVHNDGDHDLTNIQVVDTLPDCLEYVVGSATVNGLPHEPVITSPNIYEWTLPADYWYPGSAPGDFPIGEWIHIEFNADVISEGININEACVYANSAGGPVSDCDTATVVASLPPELIVVNNLLYKWNLISVPLNYSVNKADFFVEYGGTNFTWADAVSGGIVANAFFGWDRTNQMYLLSDIIDPRYGYWLWAYHDCVLKVLA